MTIDFEFNGLQVSAEVEECSDGYGTGDSPTLYDVEILEVIDEDGQDLDASDYRNIYDQLVDEAIDTYKG